MVYVASSAWVVVVLVVMPNPHQFNLVITFEIQSEVRIAFAALSNFGSLLSMGCQTLESRTVTNLFLVLPLNKRSEFVK